MKRKSRVHPIRHHQLLSVPAVMTKSMTELVKTIKTMRRMTTTTTTTGKKTLARRRKWEMMDSTVMMRTGKMPIMSLINLRARTKIQPQRHHLLQLLQTLPLIPKGRNKMLLLRILRCAKMSLKR